MTPSTLMLKIRVREELFHFIHFQDWIDHAQLRFRVHGHNAESTICVDQTGLICTRGKHFQLAKYPVRVYAVDDAPYKPQGMLGEREKVVR